MFEAEIAVDGKALKLDTAAKRALIEQQLRDDPDRSDRKIAHAVGHGICHKTVAATRARMGIAAPLGNSLPSPTDRCKDFDKHYPPGPAELATAEEAAEGENLCWFIPHQARIECSLTTDGMVEIWQEDQHGDDPDRIHVAVNNSVALARRILWAAGFKSIGIFAYAKGGGCVDLDDGDSPADVRETPGYGPVR